jgi:hypothetical protein
MGFGLKEAYSGKLMVCRSGKIKGWTAREVVSSMLIVVRL